MDENGIHLQIEFPKADILNRLKNDNRFIRLQKETVERVGGDTEFLSLNDFARLTFFHPEDPWVTNDETPDANIAAPPAPRIKEELEIIYPDTGNVIPVLSPISVPKFSDIGNGNIRLPATPLETATQAVHKMAEITTTTATNRFFRGYGHHDRDVTLNPISSTLTPALVFQDNLMDNSSTFSDTLSNSSQSEWSSEEIGAVFIVCLMVPFIILSNLFVIVSVVRFRRLHTPTNYFITSLAGVDIVVALATPWAIAVQLFQYGGGDAAHDTMLCLLPNRILMMACGVSLLILATIAYDRHTALISPLEYVNIMTSRKVVIMMVVSWLYSSAVVWFPIAAGWYDVMSSSVRCSADHLHPKVHILFVVAVFVPSCTVIMICYSRIFLVARHHAKAIAAVEFAVHRRLQVRFMIKDTKYAKTLALVIGAFLLLWLPHLIYTFIKTFGEISTNIWAETYLILLAVFNSGINPWIYAFKNNEFRAAFKRMAKEYCSKRFCKIDDRMSSLVSGVSITPRLSRTDSRMVSTILEPTTDGNEKLRRSLDSLDEYVIEIDQKRCSKYLEHHTKIAEKRGMDVSNMVTKLDVIQEGMQIINEGEGHVNWGHIIEDDKAPQLSENKYDKRKIEERDRDKLFRKASGAMISRNQSFTLGFNHVCASREMEIDCEDSSCTCKHSSSFSAPKLTRSSTSVSPSSIVPYSILNRAEQGESLNSRPLNLRISKLSSSSFCSSPSFSISPTSNPSLSRSASASHSRPKFSCQPPFVPSLPSPAPSPRSRKASTERTKNSRPRPSPRSLLQQVKDSSASMSVGYGAISPISPSGVQPVLLTENNNTSNTNTNPFSFGQLPVCTLQTNNMQQLFSQDCQQQMNVKENNNNNGKSCNNNLFFP